MDFSSGSIEFRGDSAMVVVPDANCVINIDDQQKELMSRILLCIRDYLKAVAGLLSGKLSHLRDHLPAYLSTPGNVLVSIGDDGIVIRFEKTDGKSAPRTFGMWRTQSLAEGVAALSQEVLQCREHDSIPPIMKGGVTASIGLIRNGERSELAAFQIFTVITLAPPKDLLPPPHKPHCAISIQNQLQLEFEIESTDTTKRTIGSSLTLPVGWDCIEVYPAHDLDNWLSANAAVWAEIDVLGQYITRQQRLASFPALDPRAEARRFYTELLSKFKILLDTADREEELQEFLRKHPYLLHPVHTAVWPKLPLGKHVTDFVFHDAVGDYLLVEIERADHRLFIQSGDPSAQFNHAISQTTDWLRYLEDNVRTVREEVGLKGITTRPGRLVVIGRTQTLTSDNARKLKTMQSDGLSLWTYDDVYANAKAAIENLFGPLDATLPIPIAIDKIAGP